MPAATMQLRTDNPTYDTVTKRFSQTIRLTSQEKIDAGMIDLALDHVANLFRGSMIANGLTDFVWPPEHCESRPSHDFKTATFSLATRAARQSAIVVS